MYKINTHNISGERNKVNNPDWRLVMAKYVCLEETMLNTKMFSIQKSKFNSKSQGLIQLSSQKPGVKGNECLCGKGFVENKKK